MEYLSTQIYVLLANWQQALTGGIIVSCSVIFILGLLKKAKLFEWKNRKFRKFVLALCSIVLAFPVTAVHFVFDNISFDYYLVGSVLCAFATVVLYFFYENFYLRDLVDTIGQKTVGKWFYAIRDAIKKKKSDEELQNSLVMTTDELQEEIKKEIKNRVKDDEALKGL